MGNIGSGVIGVRPNANVEYRFTREGNTINENTLHCPAVTCNALSISIQNESGYVGWSNGKAQTNNSWQRSGTVEVINADPSSGDFLKPVIRGGFEDIGAYAERGAKSRKAVNE